MRRQVGAGVQSKDARVSSVPVVGFRGIGSGVSIHRYVNLGLALGLALSGSFRVSELGLTGFLSSGPAIFEGLAGKLVDKVNELMCRDGADDADKGDDECAEMAQHAWFQCWTVSVRTQTTTASVRTQTTASVRTQTTCTTASVRTQALGFRCTLETTPPSLEP